jgi:hypothetical protein
MNLLKSFRNIGGASAQGGACASRQISGHALVVVPEWRSPWRPFHCSVHESRRHVGCSGEGFHAGIEICYRLGMGWIDWGEAFPTPEIALAESARLENRRREAVHSACDGSMGVMPQGGILSIRRNPILENAILRVHDAVLRIECAPVQEAAKLFAELERSVEVLRRTHANLSVATEPPVQEQ